MGKTWHYDKNEGQRYDDFRRFKKQKQQENQRRRDEQDEECLNEEDHFKTISD